MTDNPTTSHPTRSDEGLTLPLARRQLPVCGACGGDTIDHRGDYLCDDCDLIFDGAKLIPRFTDPQTPVCGVACTNWWHSPGAITPGRGFDCGTCLLPQGHQSPFHWTGCRERALDSTRST